MITTDKLMMLFVSGRYGLTAIDIMINANTGNNAGANTVLKRLHWLAFKRRCESAKPKHSAGTAAMAFRIAKVFTSNDCHPSSTPLHKIRGAAVPITKSSRTLALATRRYPTGLELKPSMKYKVRHCETKIESCRMSCANCAGWWKN